MLFDTKYDFVFGLGEACSCTQMLRKCRLQFVSNPYDWLFGSDILTRVKILANNYEGFIDFDDLEDTHSDNKSEKNPCEIFRNKRNNISFNHDFPYGKPLSETYDAVNEKYKRRAQRQIKTIENSSKVLAVYLQIPNNPVEVDNETLKNAHKILQNRFPNQEITLLYLYCNRENKKFNLNMIDDNIIKVCFDYDGYNKDVPYEVNKKALEELFCKITKNNKFLTVKNIVNKKIYSLRCFSRGIIKHGGGY